MCIEVCIGHCDVLAEITPCRIFVRVGLPDGTDFKTPVHDDELKQPTWNETAVLETAVVRNVAKKDNKGRSMWHGVVQLINRNGKYDGELIGQNSIDLTDVADGFLFR